MRSLRPSATFIVVVLLPLLASTARGGVIFSDDFESYPVPSNLRGQGGWNSNVGASAAAIRNGTYLPTKVIDGQVWTNGGLSWMGHALPTFDHGLDVVSTLSFRAYASSRAYPPVENNGLAFTSDVLGAGAILARWVGADVGRGKGWYFDPQGLASDSIDLTDYFYVPNSYDRVVDLTIVIDAPRLEVYGIYKDSSRVIETPHWSVTPAAIASISGIKMHINSPDGGRSGPELDNIVVTQAGVVPEPASIVSLGIGVALGLAGYRARRKPTPQPPSL